MQFIIEPMLSLQTRTARDELISSKKFIIKMLWGMILFEQYLNTPLSCLLFKQQWLIAEHGSTCFEDGKRPVIKKLNGACRLPAV